jgi:tripartite-type tricarboxylate transporter receptor subunit TctC
MHTSVKRPIQLFLIAVLISSAAPALPQDYPVKPVRIMTGSVAGMPDVIARQLAQRLSERWGKGVVVENRPFIMITAGVAAKATPDGYTLLLADRTSHAVLPSLHKDLAYDAVRDFSPITLVARAPMLLVAHPSVPAANLRELIAYAKRQPGSIDYAAAGPGTAAHIAAERFKQIAGVDLANIQYKGGGAAMAAILSGEAKVGFAPIPAALPHVKAGKVNSYAITSAKRFAVAPDIPTMAEAGLSGFDSEELWVGMFAPARTPRALIARLNRDIVEVLKTPATRDALLTTGAEPAPSTPEEFAAFIASETAMLRKVIQIARIRAD